MMSKLYKAVNYYKSAALQSGYVGRGPYPRPQYIPKRVEIFHTVRADFHFPGQPRVFIKPGEYEVTCNPLGAVSVMTDSGKLLGLRLNEFEVTEWQDNPHFITTKEQYRCNP